MAWTIDLSAPVSKRLARLHPTVRRRIISYLYDRVAAADDPRQSGLAMSGDRKGFWRYRIGDYRVVVEIIDDMKMIVVVGVGPRQGIYK